jgi:RNA polymerase sigma-70 factor (ECF subfamily)
MSSKRIEQEGRGPEESDEFEWIRRARNRDGKAFGYLVEAHQDRVYNLCFRLTGRQDSAWDLSQEAFLRAYAAMSRFKGDSKFYTWMYRIVLNLHMNKEKSLSGKMEKRSLSMDCPLRDEEGPTLLNGLPSGKDGDPSAAIVQQEREIAVQAAITALPPDQRQVVLLRDMEGFSYEEIAKIVSVPVGTVRSRLHRAREELKRRLMGAI